MSNVEYVIPQGGTAVDNDDVVVDDTPGGVTLLEANPKRTSALILNTGAQAMRVTTDGTDPSPVHGKLILTGSGLSLSSPYCPTAVVKACSVDATATSANASEVN
jgi:hypothetical protein